MSQRTTKNILFVLVIAGILLFLVALGYFLSAPRSAAPRRPAKPVKTAVSVKRPGKTPLALPVSPAAKGKTGTIAIVLDDWGYNRTHCRQLELMNVPAGIAILPNLPYSRDIIACAKAAGKEPMLHLPFQPYSAKESFDREYNMTIDLTPAEAKKKLAKILKEMSGVVGVNNHTGSKGTEDEALVTAVLSDIKRAGLFFVDSRTSEESVCGKVADKLKMRIAARDVFLDNRNERAAIENQVAWTARLAKKNGHALMIGHDRALTLQILIEQTKKLQEQGFEFVSVKEYIRRYEYSGN